MATQMQMADMNNDDIVAAFDDGSDDEDGMF